MGVFVSRKPIFTIFAASSRIFVFLATGAAEKLLISENRIKGGFQGDVGGIGGSGVQSENSFSANGIPAKRVAILSTLSIFIGCFVLFGTTVT